MKIADTQTPAQARAAHASQVACEATLPGSPLAGQAAMLATLAASLYVAYVPGKQATS
jgi:hypothetical protein